MFKWLSRLINRQDTIIKTIEPNLRIYKHRDRLGFIVSTSILQSGEIVLLYFDVESKKIETITLSDFFSVILDKDRYIAKYRQITSSEELTKEELDKISYCLTTQLSSLCT